MSMLTPLLVAGPGIAPGTRAYETLEILLLQPAILGVGLPPTSTSLLSLRVQDSNCYLMLSPLAIERPFVNISVYRLGRPFT